MPLKGISFFRKVERYMNELRLIPPNTLPVPCPLKADTGQTAKPVEGTIVDMDDHFPKGRVESFFPNQGVGVLRGRSGSEIYFNIGEVRFIGAKGANALKEGAIVGYDVSRAGPNLHVSKMKVY